MLPRSNRIRTKQDFAHVYKSGKTLKTALFRIKTTPSRTENVRAAVVIPNKLCKSAVLRNRKKRQIMAIMRDVLPLVVHHADIVLMPEAAAITATSEEMRVDIITGLTKIGFLPRPVQVKK